jgi:hypothetical protein
MDLRSLRCGEREWWKKMLEAQIPWNNAANFQDFCPGDTASRAKKFSVDRKSCVDY